MAVGAVATEPADTLTQWIYLLRLADNPLVLAQRLGEWVGKAPMLEEEMALVNIGLDLLGQARMLLSYAANLSPQYPDEDALAFQRDVLDFHNVLLVEQANGDFAMTMMRQFLFSTFSLHQYMALASCRDVRLAGIAAKALPEVRYHVRHSGQWVLRLGDGTEDSHRRAQSALDQLWMYTGELFECDDVERQMIDAGLGVSAAELREAWQADVQACLSGAGLVHPEDGWMQTGGRNGHHSEHLGYLLCEMQFMQRAYPNAKW
jgi:ring-1,2-phenylacetyl-CoA epoxidase subunit PaaC